MLYSHSRLKCFEQCPLKFRLRYKDKVESEAEQGIEAFLGSMVHKTLEKLYRDVKFKKENSLEGLLEFFNAEWKRNWNDGVIIVRKDYSQENYRKMGEQFITDYYSRNKPFDDGKILGLEKRVIIKIDPEGRYKLQGFVDRLMTTGDGKYEIHDYKTNAELPFEEYMKEDRQLALYSLSVLNSYQDAEKVKLVWHFLAFDKRIVLEKTPEELEELKRDVIRLIDRIKSTKDFKPMVSKLCDWCEFRSLCPEWKHVVKTETLAPNKFLKENGVKLVNRYAELQMEKNSHIERIEEEMEQVKEAMLKLCEKKGITVLNGSNHTARIWTKDVMKFPGKNDEEREEMERLIKKSGRWEDLSQLDNFKLSKLVEAGEMPKDLLEKLKKFGKKERIERIYLKQKSKES